MNAVELRSDDSKVKLFEAAIILINKCGYSKTGISSICDHAQTTKGSLYYHYTSKEELCRAASDYYWQKAKRKLDAIFSPCLSALEQLESFINFLVRESEHCTNAHSTPLYSPLFTPGTLGCDGNSLARDIAVQMHNRGRRYISTLLHNLQVENHLKSEHNLEQLADVILQYIQGLLLYAQLHNDHEIVKADLKFAICRLIKLKV